MEADVVLFEQLAWSGMPLFPWPSLQGLHSLSFVALFSFQGWLYPAELTSLPIRAQANGVSTVANW